MKASVCVTVLNEERSISDLLLSLILQTKKPDEIIIVDGGSKDNTIPIIKHYQKKYNFIRLITDKVSRARGRNIAVSASKNDVIAVTDGGCIPRQDWLENITNPFENKKVEVVAGFYKMVAESRLQKALSVFLGTLPKKFRSDFLPSARSIAFRKFTFEKLSGFPELMKDTAEDSLFVINIVRQGIKIVRVKKAIVVWNLPDNIKGAAKKFYKYALGDVRSGVWVHPVYGILSHNVKAALICFRYLFFILLLFLSFFYPPMLIILFILFLCYFTWAFRKVYTVYKDIRIGIWGILIQITSDLSVISGFLHGIMGA
jgi:glycosyltransferase involved in cell wall biosynthesis